MEEPTKAPQATVNGQKKPEETKPEEEEEAPKPAHKFFSKFKAFMKKMTEPDEEDK